MSSSPHKPAETATSEAKVVPTPTTATPQAVTPASTSPIHTVDKKSRAPISVIILTLNEEINIRACVASCEWCDDIHVLDSGSTDRTQEIAREMGAQVHYNAFKSFGEQRNWAIDNIPTKHKWIFHLDADERFTEKLVIKMSSLLASGPQEAGFHVPHKVMFMGRWIKRSAGYPTYQMRLFHKDRMRFIDYGHGQRENEDSNIGVVDVPYLHFSFSKGIYDWLDKHNRYSTLEALQVLQGKDYEWRYRDLLFANKIHRRRAWKELTYRLPLRSKLRWFGILFISGGILEGSAGLAYANLMAIYENMISTKLKVLRSQVEMGSESLPPSLREPTQQFDPMDTPYTRKAAEEKYQKKHLKKFSLNDSQEDRHVQHNPDAPPTSRDTQHLMEEFNLDHLPQMQPESSPWSFKGKLARAAWMLIGSKLFRFSFHNWYRYRRILLRLFGAKIGKNVVIRPSAHIEIPWTLTIEDCASIGDKAIIYSLGKIHIGKRAIISQYAHLCAGTHDYTDHTFKLIRTPISIGDDCWIGTDTFIGPGVTIGTLSVVGARSSVYKDIPPGKVAVGNPSKVIKDRELN